MRRNERHPLLCYEAGNRGKGGGSEALGCIDTALLYSINNTSLVYLHAVRDSVITLCVGLMNAIQVCINR